jgi:hypothetical protein
MGFVVPRFKYHAEKRCVDLIKVVCYQRIVQIQYHGSLDYRGMVSGTKHGIRVVSAMYYATKKRCLAMHKIARPCQTQKQKSPH